MPRLPTPEQRQRLRQELKTPYRGLRQTLYGVAAISAGIGAAIFALKAIAGGDLSELLPNLALQLAVLGTVVALWRWEQRSR